MKYSISTEDKKKKKRVGSSIERSKKEDWNDTINSRTTILKKCPRNPPGPTTKVNVNLNNPKLNH
jgi:hypothetical protein